MKKSFLVLMLLSATIFSAHSKSKSTTVIYGDDNREDVFSIDNSLLLRLAESTAAAIQTHKIQEFNLEQIVLKGENLTSNMICESERFSKQPAVAHCSGFLVAENILVTAGHCMDSEQACSGTSWVFDYKVDYADQEEIILDKSKVYGCKKIISQKLTEDTLIDYAVIELDRPVKDRKPLKMRKQGKPAVGDEIVVIGHPSGLPTKITDGAKIRNVNDVFFAANLDTYGGNSGSAVFNLKSGLVEGILVRGEEDFVASEDGMCGVSNKIGEDEGRGEDVTLITIVEGLPKK